MGCNYAALVNVAISDQPNVFLRPNGAVIGGLNRALNRPVTASSIEKSVLPAAYAVDGNTATRWSSAWSDPQWIFVDLGATFSISRVKLVWETAYARSYKIQVSNDANTWSDIYSTTTGNGATDDLPGLSGSGRYVRVYGSQRSTTYGYSLYEFEVY
jgi:hexosaminidase